MSNLERVQDYIPPVVVEVVRYQCADPKANAGLFSLNPLSARLTLSQLPRPSAMVLGFVENVARMLNERATQVVIH